MVIQSARATGRAAGPKAGSLRYGGDQPALRFDTVTAMTTRSVKRQFETAAGVLRWVRSHPANRGDRRALPRAVWFQLRGRLGLRTQVRLGDRSKVWAVLHNTASAKVAYASPPDWAEMQAWRGLLHDNDLFVDVGANAGTYSVWAADLGAEVIAIEPGAEARSLLDENARLNPHARITVVESALGARAGEMSFTQGRDAMNHVLPQAEGGLRVQVRTLDEVLGSRAAAGVKVDVEGAERLVLEGAETALRERRIAVLQLEWNERSQEVLGGPAPGGSDPREAWIRAAPSG